MEMGVRTWGGMNFYNEHDPKAAAWLRELIERGCLPVGVVDERSICDLTPSELTGFTQCHFFAGIGGWSLALELAGWSPDWPIWTGSCPCQPFSAIGEGKGTDDERHLWPDWRWLIQQCQPPAIVGEQVASKAGRDWLAGVFIDLAELGYSGGGADLCAAGVGAPHGRQRLFWVGDASGAGLEGHLRNVGAWPKSGWRVAGEARSIAPAGVPWDSFAALACRDGKTRRIECGTFPVAHGLPANMGRLRGYGNAIVPQVAAEFIRAALM